MFQTMPKPIMGSGSGNSFTQVYSPTASEGDLVGTSIPVTSGRHYLISGTIRQDAVNTYGVSGGNMIGNALVSQGAGVFGGVAIVSVVILVKATSSSIILSISGTNPHLYSGQICEIG